VFHTAVCVLDTRSGTIDAAIDRTEVVFRPLSADEIARYVARENPLDAAGSFKAEGAGIALFERIESTDPTALIGLPLIALARLLRAAGFTLP
jgi:septum formation protein